MTLFPALLETTSAAIVREAQGGPLVYFVQADDACVKVGLSSRPVDRLKTLQVGSAVRLRLVALMVGSRAIESHFHQMFESCGIGGEWFRPDALVLEAIRQVRLERGIPA